MVQMMVNQEEIHKKSCSNDPEARGESVEQLRRNFNSLSDKQAAWEDLIKLVSDQNADVRLDVNRTIGKVFQYMPDRQKAWEDLHRMTADENYKVREGAATALGIAFSTPA